MGDKAPAKAKLWEIGPDGNTVSDPVEVQFNPETLKVSFANQVVPPGNTQAGDQNGTTATQYVGKGTTKLSVQLWFDATGVLPQGQTDVTDVRELTKKVAYFITPKDPKDPKEPNKRIPPGVRFLWGTFMFDGIMESLEESLEFFSPEGKPLRASVALSLIQQNIQFAFAPAAAGGPLGIAAPGTRPLAQAVAGTTLQALADGLRAGVSWQDIAAANRVENPRLLQPGQLIDLNPPGLRVPR